MFYFSRRYRKHDCPVMFAGGWTTRFAEGTVGVCADCGRPYRVIRPAYADRLRWSRLVWASSAETAIIEEQEAVPV